MRIITFIEDEDIGQKILNRITLPSLTFRKDLHANRQVAYI